MRCYNHESGAGGPPLEFITLLDLAFVACGEAGMLFLVRHFNDIHGERGRRRDIGYDARKRKNTVSFHEKSDIPTFFRQQLFVLHHLLGLVSS